MNMIEMFEDAEKEFWTLKIKGINYWHIVRMSVNWYRERENI